MRDPEVAAGPAFPRVAIGGVDFDVVREEDVTRHVLERVSAGQGGVIVTPNVDVHRVLRRLNGGDILRRADLVVADGMPLVWASRLQRQPLPERVTGSSLVWSLSRAASVDGRSVFLLGAAPGVADTAAAKLQERIPDLRVAGTCSPDIGFEKSPEALDAIVASLSHARPDLVFVALGCPKQEQLMMRLAPEFPRAWFLGCGGSLDFVAGKTRRAPVALQKLGLEWMYRLAHEPRRLAKRYLVHGTVHGIAVLAESTLRGRGYRSRSLRRLVRRGFRGVE